MSADDDDSARAPAPGEATEVDSGQHRRMTELRRRMGHLGRFEVTGTLGAGGMGEVLQVSDPEIGRTMAAKVIRGAAAPETIARFRREARITGQLEHPNIVPVHDLGSDDGQPFFTMKQVQGRDLAQHLADLADLAETRRNALPQRALLGIFQKVCHAVGFAHAHGVIHRDLKPDNVMVGAHGEVLVMDWGLARRLDEDDDDGPAGARDPHDSGQTLDGQILGTPVYMPPEQARGEIARLDQRADIYSLGAMLYQLLSLEPPYRGDSARDVLARVQHGPPPPLASRAPGIPHELISVVEKAMAREPAARYQTVDALRADIDAYLDGRFVGAASYGPLQALAVFAARHRFALGIAVAALLTVAAVATRAQWQSRAAARAQWREVSKLESDHRARRALDEVRRGERRTDRPLAPPLEETRRRTELVRELHALGSAYDKLLLIDPDDARARARLRAVLLLQARLAILVGDDLAAGLALDRASHLGADVDALRARASSRRARQLKAHADRIQQRLAEARAGALAHPDRFRQAVVELSSFREEQTARLLLTILRDATATLRTTWRDAHLAAAPADQRAALTPVVDAALAHLRIAGDPPAPPLAPAHQASLRSLRAALAGQLDTAGRNTQLARRTWQAALSLRQTRALGEHARALPLACEVLGQLGGSDATATALARYLVLEMDSERSRAAGRSLALLASEHARAEQLLHGLLGLTDRRLRRYAEDSDWWNEVRHHYRRTSSDAPAIRPADMTVDQLIARVRILYAQQRDAEALALVTSALDRHPDHPRLRYERGIARFRAGDGPGALSDFDHAIAHFDAGNQWAEVYANRGAVRNTLGDHQGARSDAERALSTDRSLVMAWVVLGEALRSLGDLDDARKALRQAHTLAPESANVMRSLAQTLMERRELREALHLTRTALSREPGSAPLHQLHGRVLEHLNRPREAITAYDKAVALAPRRAGPLIDRGKARYTLGYLDMAERDFQAALAIRRSVIALVNLSAVLTARGDLERAGEATEEALRLHPRSSRAHAARASWLKFSNRLTEAAAAYARAVALDGRKAVPTRLLHANALIDIGQHDEARAIIEAALRQEPWRAACWTCRARLHVETGRIPDAHADLDAALQRAPRDPLAHRLRGNAHHVARQWQAAIDAFDRSLQLGGPDRDSLANRGVCKAALGHHQAAIKDYTASLAIGPRSDVHFNRANAHKALGQGKQALADYTHAIRLDRRHYRALVNRSQLHRNADQLQQAVADSAAAVALAPTNAVVRLNHGQMLLATEHPDAIRELAHATRLGPELWQTWYHLARAQAAAGRTADAAASLQQARRVAPPSAHATIDTLRARLSRR